MYKNVSLSAPDVQSRIQKDQARKLGATDPPWKISTAQQQKIFYKLESGSSRKIITQLARKKSADISNCSEKYSNALQP